MYVSCFIGLPKLSRALEKGKVDSYSFKSTRKMYYYAMIGRIFRDAWGQGLLLITHTLEMIKICA